MMSWETDLINKGLEYGGEQVSEEHYQARLAICKRCPHFGLVTLPTGQLEDGCTICGCPAATKPRWKKYFSFSKLKIIKAVCPDYPNRWDTVDRQFFNN